ncbi:MAG TPA: hypothetical protein VGL66_16110 [Caulobacteraceae bacterium]|jgi:hypothetical protein
MDALGVLGAAAAVWAVVFSKGTELEAYAPYLREAGLLLLGCALVVRVVDAIVRGRDRRNEARRELLRRLSAVNHALLDLRGSLSREHARAFLDRRRELTAGIEAAARWLTPEETRQFDACDVFCDRMAAVLGDAGRQRAALSGSSERLRREIERAARRGDFDRHDADNLSNLVDDAIAVIDEAIYAEWNTDHFGRLHADNRAFVREIERYRSTAADRIERQGASLFDLLDNHVRKRIEVIDLLADWEQTCRRLELRLAGLKPQPPRLVSSTDAPRPRLADRFTVLPGRTARADDEPQRLRLPAAND